MSNTAKYLLGALSVTLLVLIAESNQWRTLSYHGKSKSALKQPLDTTVCAIVEDPAAFNNTIVRIKGHINTAMEYSLLYGDGCDDPIWFAYGPSADVPNMDYIPGRVPGTPIPIKLVRDSNFDNFERLLDSRSDKRQGDWFFSQWVTATFVGRVDTVPPEIHAAHKNGKPTRIGIKEMKEGFGHLGLFDVEFVMQSVEGDAAIGTAREGTTSRPWK